MGQQIIKQPNGKYAVFSSIIDGFTMVDCTREEIIEERIARAREEIIEKVTADCDTLDKGGKPYYQFTMTWSEAVALHKQHHGPVRIE